MAESGFWDGAGAPPAIDREAVRPSVDEVAILLRTRTVTEGGHELDTFTEDTRPTAVEVERVVDHVVDEVLGQLPDRVDVGWYPPISRVIALRAAAVIEVSFFREQANETAPAWAARFATDLDALRDLIAGPTFVA